MVQLVDLSSFGLVRGTWTRRINPYIPAPRARAQQVLRVLEAMASVDLYKSHRWFSRTWKVLVGLVRDLERPGFLERSEPEQVLHDAGALLVHPGPLSQVGRPVRRGEAQRGDLQYLHQPLWAGGDWTGHRRLASTRSEDGELGSAYE